MLYKLLKNRTFMVLFFILYIPLAFIFELTKDKRYH